MGADLRLMLPGEACVACLGGLRNPEEAEYEASGPPGAMRRGPHLAWSDQRAGSLVTLNSIACNLAVQMYLDLLDGRIQASRWVHLEYDSAGMLEQSTEAATAGGECRVCGIGK